MANALQHTMLILSVLLSPALGIFYFARNSQNLDTNTLFGNPSGTPFNPTNTGNNAATSFSNVIQSNNDNTVSSLGSNTMTNQVSGYNNNNNVVNNRCVQRSARDFRPHPADCAKFTMCSNGNLLTFDCPRGSVFHDLSESCVPQGSYYDTCSRAQASQLICPPGATYKKAHPHHCAQYYHCGQPSQNRLWENHLKECEYPMLFNDMTNRCEHYTMVGCGPRKEPLDPCEYRANICEGHVHCVPCKVRHPSCRGKADGMNSWKGREGSPYYVVCANQRVVYHGMCAQANGVQVFDDNLGMCKYLNSNNNSF